MCILVGYASCKPMHIPDSIKQSKEIFTFSISNTNFYIVKMENGYSMIDCGYQKDLKKVEKAILKAGIPLEEIHFLILTHAHGDHVGNAKHFRDTYGIKIIAGHSDLEQFEEGANGPLCPTSTLASVLASFSPEGFPVVSVDYLVKDSLDLSDIGAQGKVYVQGGHTPGSLYYTFKEHAFIGDQLRGKIMKPKVPTQHFYMCDIALNLVHIKDLLRNPKHLFFYPGHFGILQRSDVETWLDNEYLKISN